MYLLERSHNKKGVDAIMQGMEDWCNQYIAKGNEVLQVQGDEFFSSVVPHHNYFKHLERNHPADCKPYVIPPATRFYLPDMTGIFQDSPWVDVGKGGDWGPACHPGDPNLRNVQYDDVMSLDAARPRGVRRRERGGCQDASQAGVTSCSP